MKREEVLSSIKALALKTLPPSSTLLLYGSRARGDNHKGSDWDLLILLDKASLSFNDYSVGYPFRELGWEINEEINPQVYSIIVFATCCVPVCFDLNGKEVIA